MLITPFSFSSDTTKPKPFSFMVGSALLEMSTLSSTRGLGENYPSRTWALAFLLISKVDRIPPQFSSTRVSSLWCDRRVPCSSHRLGYGTKEFLIGKARQFEVALPSPDPECTSHRSNVPQIIKCLVSPVVPFGVDVLRADFMLTWHSYRTLSWITMTCIKVWHWPVLFMFLFFSLMNKSSHLYWDFTEF